jgi:hypothetical protein
MATNTAVFGIFRDRPQVELAIIEFRRAGVRPHDVSVLFPEAHSTKEFAHEKHTKAPEGAATGAGTGAVLGGTLGWLVGIGALAIPGLGPFIAAGPIMAALAGAGVGGAVAADRRADRHGDRVRGQTAAIRCTQTAAVTVAPRIAKHLGAASSTSEARHQDRNRESPPASG